MTSDDPRLEDDRVGAFVDDEMTPEEAEAFARALGDDPALARQVDIQDRLRGKLRASHVLETPPSDAIMRLLEEPKPTAVVVPLRRPWAHTAIPAGLGFALAASIAVAVGVTQIGSGGDVAVNGGAMVARGGLARALDGRLGTDAAPDGIKVVASFRTVEGRYCRIFHTFDAPQYATPTTAQSTGLACKDGAGWTVASLATPSRREDGDYRQAGSTLPRAVVAAMSDLDLSQPLTAQEEQAARASGWSAR